MKKNFLLIVVFMVITNLSPNNLNAQVSRHAIYGEALGSGGIGSVNYDVGLTTDGKLRVRLGVGLIPGILSNSSITFPIQFNYLIGKNTHFLELGFGATFLEELSDNENVWFSRKATDPNMIPSGSIMYRRQKMEGGFMWKVGLAPFLFEKEIFPFVGLGIGYAW